ncbi:hypothetical protein [Georgenia sp. AZ-5]|uniref:hypothetical protein n=1 Tax=Georgenia sp. AZ-5 TaxID=3367526 RepID=UPI00375410AD
MPSGQVEDASRETGLTPAAPAPRWLRSLGRFACAALGVLWFLLGWLALQVALGSSSRPEASQQAPRGSWRARPRVARCLSSWCWWPAQAS